MTLFYSIITSIFGVFFKVFHRNKVYGVENIPQGAAIIAPNHLSFYDPPLIAGSLPSEASFLARASLFHNPVINFLISRLNAHPVTGGPQDLSSLKLIIDLLQKNQRVVIFPEGRRSFDGELAPIKSGIGMLAQRGKCPIIPTYIHGTFAIWNRFHKYPKLYGKTAVVFGTPIQPTNFDHLNKKEAQEEIAKSVQQALENLKAWYESGAKGTPP